MSKINSKKIESYLEADSSDERLSLSFLDLAAIRQILESETGHGGEGGGPGVGAVACPSCGMPFDKGKKRRLIDACGHERCYACMFHNEACPLCKPKITPAQNNHGQTQRTQSNYSIRFGHRDPRTEIRDDDWHSPTRLPKPPSRNQGNLAQSSPTPSHSRRRFFLSPKSLRSPFGQRRSNSRDENRVPLSDDEGISVKSGSRSRASSGEAARRSSQSDLHVRLGLLLGDGRRRVRDNSASVASLDAHTLASHNTSPVSTLTGSSEVECATAGLGSAPSLASVSLASNSSSPAARRHSLNPLQNGRSDEYNKLPTGLFKNRKTASRRSARMNNKNGSGELKKPYHPSPQLTLRPLFFEVPTNDEQQIFSGRQWLISDMEEILGSSSPGVVISGSPGTGKTALVLQLVQQSCFGRRGGEDYECLREPHEPKPRVTLARLAAHVVAYHFCQADNNSTCLVGEFVHSIAAQLCQSPRLQAYREYLLNEPHLLSCLSIKECIADPDLAFMRGVIEPLVILRRCGSIDQTNSIILVDGLCEAEYHRPDHGDTITSFLARFVPQMPSWLKVVATVRSQLLDLTKQLPYTRLSLDESDNVQKDLLDYIATRIQTNPLIEQNIKSTIGKSDGAHNNVSKFSQYLLHLSEGSFLFVKLTLDLCEKGHIVIKSSNYKVVPVSLAQIFLLQFNLRFPTLQSFEKVTHILSVCLAALYPLTLVEIYYSVNSLLVDTFLPWEEFCQRFDLLSDFLVKRIDNTYMFFHPSFREWLIRRDDSESPKFLCDLRAGHCGIAFRLSRVQAPLDPEKTMELGHHILKAHLYRNLGPAQLGLCPRDLQAAWVSSSSISVGEAIANMRNIYTPNVKVSRLMLLAGGSANQITDCLGNAPLLCIYAYQGILSMVSLLLEFGADLQMTNSQGCTALSLACQRGHIDVAKRLIASGASLSFPDTAEQTPLVHAAKNGHRDTVMYLLGCQSASETREESEGDRIPGARHALIAAAQNGHVDIVECLLDTAELQCDVICDVTGETALSAASYTGACDVADLLLSRGASPRAHNARDASPLSLASRAGRVTLVTRLLRAGADPTPPAVLAAVSEGHVAILDMLLDNGGDVNSADAEGISALGWACLRARVDVARLLLSRGANPGQCDAAGRSPLCLSCAGTPELVELLLDHGAILERVDLNGIRPLDRAIGQRNVPVVNCFLRKGAKLGPTTWAMAAGKPEFMLILLNKLLEDGNSLYRRGRLSEASHRYRYALRKLPPPAGAVGAPELTDPSQGAPNDPFLQLHTNLLLNLSRCKRKLHEPLEAVELATRASALRPSSFECAYALARAVLAHERPADALPHARRALLLAPPGSDAVPTLHALQREILARINAHTHGHAHTDNRSLRNYDTLSLNMP